MNRRHPRWFLASFVSILATLLIIQSAFTAAPAGVTPQTTATASVTPAEYVPLVVNTTTGGPPAPTPTGTLVPTGLPTPTSTVLASCDITTGFPNLEGRFLSGCNLTGALLGGADLSNADLGDADLGDADLGDTILIDTILAGANLTGVPLVGANGGTTATVTSVLWNNTVCPDTTNSNSDGSTCVGHAF